MKYSVIGCGWLGLPLAKHWVSMGHEVMGSTTTAKKLVLLKDMGITPFLLDLAKPLKEDTQELFQTELAFINIPPQGKVQSPKTYANQIKVLVEALEKGGCTKIIFISSTSYYPNTNDWVTLKTTFDLGNGSKKAVVLAEESVKSFTGDVVILRSGGLMGKDRIPGQWFGGKKTEGADTPVNYIHQEDAIRIASEFLKEWPSGKNIYNLVSPDHATRKSVHEAMAQKYGFEPPQWVQPVIKNFKIVESSFRDRQLRSPLEF